MGEDMISLLPDPLLCQILSELPTKNVVCTSVLSKRWKTLWLSVPVLDLHDIDFFDYNSFVTFVDNFFDFSKDSCLQQLKLSLQGHEDDDSSYIKPWIDTATMRKVQHLHIQLRPRCIVRELMALSLYICETLVCLKLSFVSLPDFEYVSLPCLRIMHLEMVRCFNDDNLLEKLISSCSVLEDLKVVRNVEEGAIKVLRVRSQTLRSLVLVLHGDQTWDESDADADDWEVVIDAPRLEFFSLKDNWSTSFVINQLRSSAKVDIDVAEVGVPIPESVVMNFLIGLSSVWDMTISRTTFKIIISNYEKSELLLQFPHMTRFHASFYNSDLEKLPDFLESCPNLRFLFLELQEFKKNEHVSISLFVPECLRSSLEYVEIKRPISGAEAEIKLVKYFLENSVKLKKFKVRLSCRRMNEESIILNELLRLRRCSASCEVIAEVEET